MRTSLLLVAFAFMAVLSCTTGVDAFRQAPPAAPAGGAAVGPAGQKCQIMDGTFYSTHPAACTASKCKDNQGEFPSYDVKPGTTKCPSGQGCCPQFGKPAGVSDLRAKRLEKQTQLKSLRNMYGGKKIPNPAAAAKKAAAAAPAPPAPKKVAGPPSALREKRLAAVKDAKNKKSVAAMMAARAKLDLERAYPKCKSDCEWHNGPACDAGYEKCKAFKANCMARCGPAPGGVPAPLTAAQKLDKLRADAAKRGYSL